MKKLLTLTLVGAALGSMNPIAAAAALTVKSDVFRVAQIVKHAKFPLDLDGYLDLSFRLDINEEAQDGVKATVDRLIDGEVVDTFKGFLAYGKKQEIEFADGSLGPKLVVEASPTDVAAD